MEILLELLMVLNKDLLDIQEAEWKDLKLQVQ